MRSRSLAMPTPIIPAQSTLPSSPETARQHGARRALQVAWGALAWTLIALFFLFGALLLVVRYAVMPRADELRPRVEQIVSRALKTPVSIGHIEASWRSFNPHLALHDVRVNGSEGGRGLSLPNVEGTVSWLSALALQPRFSSLHIEAPELDVARLADDRFSIAGFVIDPAQKDEGPGLFDWVLAQGEITIRDARVRYSDQRRSAATAFELTQVDLRLENQFGSHMLGLKATPTAAVAGPIDVRARFRHSPFARSSDTTRWAGEVFGALDFADLAALARIFDAPVRLESAQGAVRSWVTFDQARLTRVVADVALKNVNVTLADDLEPLTLTSLQGRVSQRRWGDDSGDSASGGQEFEANRLALVTVENQAVAPLDFKLRTTRAKGSTAARTQVQASRIDLQDLAWFATHIPLARELREMITRHAIDGVLTGLSASWHGPTVDATTLSLRTNFEGVASAAQSATQPALPVERHTDTPAIGLPGFENLSGSIDVADGAGSMQLASKDVVLIFPGVFAEPRVKLAKLNASLTWKSSPILEIHVASAATANADLELEASGIYRAGNHERNGPGWLDLTGRIARLNAPAIFRYVPTVAGSNARDWLQHALVAGRVTGGVLRVKGDLARFPFHSAQEGELRVTARVSGATLDVYPAAAQGDRADGSAQIWPLLSGIDAELLFDRDSVTITAERGAVHGVRLTPTVARISQLGRDAVLDVQGVAEGPLADMLRYVNASPVARWIGGVTTRAEASGNAKLDLRLGIPLHDAETDATVAGALHFANNDIALADAPPLARVNGTLGFTEAALRSNNLSASMLGGPAKIEASTRADGGIVFGATGIATVAGLRRAITLGPVEKLLDRSQGSARYTATVTVKPTPELRIESDLVGMAIDGIAPLSKTAQEAMPLVVERTERTAGSDELRVTAGSALAVHLERRREQGTYRVARGVIALNEAANLPESGVLVLATVPRLDLEAWSSLLAGNAAADASATDAPVAAGLQLPIDLFAVRTQELVLMGRSFRNVTLGATRTADGGFDANVVSDGVVGHVAWRPERITARLSRLSIPAARKSEVVEVLRSPPKQLPALDITAEQFELADLKLGRLELLAQDVGAASAPAWRVRRLDIANADMKLTARGEWAPASTTGSSTAARRMTMSFKLDARDAGATLDRLGFPGAMAAGQGALEGDMDWLGSPLDIDYPTLSGKLSLNLDSGRFLKVETGNAARLLSLLSLQSLSRTLLFDGGRQFADGFAYQSIRADAVIKQGVISTDNFRMAGTSAAALMSGTIDLRNETQRLHLVVLPEIDASTAALALGVANPILGLGAFLAQYVLRNPLSKAFALEYDISGTWTDPVIAQRGKGTADSATSAEQIR